ncbi:MAG: hypothetical protein JWL93_272 [Hyphomicrobiales bacterium]|nr:hypothetical protein [Hyphomicrobiales bacterium]
MSDDNFLARWSQRKRQIAREAEKQAVAPPEPAEPDTREPAEPLDLSLLPRIEDLTDASDITAFLQKGVPDALRNAALRRAWALDPMVRDYVGDALDYAWDWNVAGGVPGSGELQAGTDVARMVQQVFGDAPAPENEKSSQADEKVNSFAAPQNAPVDTATASGSGQMSDDETQDPDSLPQVDAAATEVIAADIRIPEHVAPQQKSRRHGGAVPSS